MDGKPDCGIAAYAPEGRAAVDFPRRADGGAGGVFIGVWNYQTGGLKKKGAPFFFVISAQRY